MMLKMQDMRPWHSGTRRVLGLCVGRVLAVLAMTMSLAHAQSSPYQFSVPPGWARADEDGSILLRPPGEAANSVILMLLPPVSRLPDLDSQFTALRTGFESGLGLGSMRDAQQQRFVDAGTEQRAHFASYASAGGDRYLALMARAEGALLATVVFITTSGEAYNRLRQPAADLFNGLRIAASDAARVDSAPTPRSQIGAPSQPTGTGATAVPAATRSAPGSASYRGSGIVGVWTGTATLRNSSAPIYGTIGVQAWYVFFDDGLLLQTFPDAGLAGFDREAFRSRFPREWQTYRLNGAAGSTQRQDGAAPWTLQLVGGDELKINGSSFQRCPDVNGKRLQGTWFQRTAEDADDPDFVRRPRGKRPLIRFTSDGRFDDEGLFAVALASRSGGDDRPGAGSYEIRDYSIFLRYDDGRLRQEAFPGRAPALAFGIGVDDRIVIRGATLLKR